MRRDPLLGVHTDGCDLPPVGPHASLAGVALGDDVQRGEAINEHLLDLPEVPVQVFLVTPEVNDRVSDQLAGAVKCHVAAALDIKQLDASRSERS